MRSIRLAAGAALGAFVLTTGSIGASAPSSKASAPARATQAQQGGGEFVVAYEGSPQDAAAAVADAGGTLVDVNEEAGIALATAPDAAFLNEVRTEGAITGAARNHSVGAL